MSVSAANRTSFTVDTTDLKRLYKKIQHAEKKFKSRTAVGLEKAALWTIRKAQRETLRNSSGKSNPDKLNRKSGQLATNVTFSVNESGMFVQIGWWRNKYAHVVAEPPAGISRTIIRPKNGRFLWFPISKKAWLVWHARKEAKSFKKKNGEFGVVIAGKRLVHGKDYIMARQVKIKARRPLSSIVEKNMAILSKIIMKEISVVE